MTVHALRTEKLNIDADSFVRGLPSAKNERFKYTDLSVFEKQAFLPGQHVKLSSDIIAGYRLQHTDAILLVLVNGCFDAVLSDLAKLPQGVIALSMQAARSEQTRLVDEYQSATVDQHLYPFAQLNLSEPKDGLFLYVPQRVTLSAPIHLLHVMTTNDVVRTQTQNLFIVAEASAASILQEYVSLNVTPHYHHVTTTIHTAPKSKLEIVKQQHENQQAVHMENYFIHQQQDSHVYLTQINMGAAFARDDVAVSLHATGAVCHTSGFYHTTRDNQYVDHHVDVLHQAANTQSDMLYKGIIDKKSRAVFNGRLHVAAGAQKIQAVQGNHHLLLSAQGEAYSKPELEIYADDVKCRHGATTGQIDQDALFYLRARGIPQAEAVQLLLKSFAEDILQRIQHGAIREYITRQVHDEK